MSVFCHADSIPDRDRNGPGKGEFEGIPKDRIPATPWCAKGYRVANVNLVAGESYGGPGEVLTSAIRPLGMTVGARGGRKRAPWLGEKMGLDDSIEIGPCAALALIDRQKPMFDGEGEDGHGGSVDGSSSLSGAVFGGPGAVADQLIEAGIRGLLNFAPAARR